VSYVLFNYWHLLLTSHHLCGRLRETNKTPNKTVDLATWLSGVSGVAIATLGITHFERIARTHALVRVSRQYRSCWARVLVLRGGLLTLSVLVLRWEDRGLCKDAERTPLFSVAWYERGKAFDGFKMSLRRWSWPASRHRPSIRLEWLTKTTKTQDSWCLCRDSKGTPAGTDDLLSSYLCRQFLFGGSFSVCYAEV
jgi:hypothetical protein